MTDSTVLKIALAGLLHDVGKFAWKEAMNIIRNQERRRVCL